MPEEEGYDLRMSFPRFNLGRVHPIGPLVLAAWLGLLAGCGSEGRDVEPATSQRTPIGFHLDLQGAWSLAGMAAERLQLGELRRATGPVHLEYQIPEGAWSRDPVLSVPTTETSVWRATLSSGRLETLSRKELESVRLRHGDLELVHLTTPSPPLPGSFVVLPPDLLVALPKTFGEPRTGWSLSYAGVREHIADPIARAVLCEDASGPVDVKCGVETRPAFLLAGGGRLTWERTPADGESLRLGLGLLRATLEHGAEGLRIEQRTRGSIAFQVRARCDAEDVTLWQGEVSCEDPGFQDVILPLERFGRQRVTFSVTIDQGTPRPGHVENLVAVSVPFHAVRTTTSPRNVILISLDTWRADGLSCVDDERVSTPNLDRFAAEGRRFARHYTSSPWTLPAHTSLFTSLFPVQHGVIAKDHRVPRDAPDFPSLLRARGYRTAAFTGGGFLSAYYGFHRGFDSYRAANLGVVDLVERANRWLEDAPRPFFLFLHTYEIHSPYAPPEPLRSRRVTTHDSELPVEVREDDIQERIDAGTLTASDRRYTSELYHAGIEWTDHALGDLFAKLDTLGLRDDTMVIVTSDHGEELFEHAGIGHGQTLFEEVLRIPLLVRAPGFTHAGEVVTQLTRIEDVAPTIFDWLDLPVPASWSGRSLRSTPENATFQLAHLRFLYASHEAPALVIGREKVIEADPAYARTRDASTIRVFDLERDPEERSPLAPTDPRTLALRDRLHHDLRFFRTKALEADVGVLPPEEQRELDALGYFK